MSSEVFLCFLVPIQLLIVANRGRRALDWVCLGSGISTILKNVIVQPEDHIPQVSSLMRWYMYNGRTDNEDKSQHGLSGIELCSSSALYHLLALVRAVNVGITEYDINAKCAAHRASTSGCDRQQLPRAGFNLFRFRTISLNASSKSISLLAQE